MVFAATTPRICVQFESPAPDAVLEWRFDELERAGLLALDALRLGEQLKSARCAGYLREFQADMRQVGSTGAVRDFTEQARASALWQQATAGAMAE